MQLPKASGGEMELISAVATASGAGGVAIVRVSGEGALALAQQMFSHKGEFEPNRLYPGKIDCGPFSDYGMCVYFRAPRSFTGEDTVEFHCHGGTEIARGVWKRTIELGARAAERGEFTRRAFLNGKLSLSAAEGMAEMISAQSEAQVKAGFLLYGETLTREGKRLQTEIRECLAYADADVDYPEEDLSADARREVAVRLRKIKEALGGLLSQYRVGKKIRSGVNVVICGEPNAGKSSLLNALLGYERAIVSQIPGTTRDAVEGTLEIGGVLFRLTDTAGLRESQDALEQEGIRRAKNAIAAADVVVLVREGGAEGHDMPKLSPGTALITISSKSDLVRSEKCDLCVSALTGEGIEALKELLYERGFGRENGEAYLLEERHYGAVREAAEAVDRALEGTEKGAFAELYAEDLRRAYVALGLLSGETATEEIIAEIFSKFCVGK